MEYELVRRHSPAAIVFENGLGGRLDWWSKVIPDISRDTTVFAYNRPGYGASAPAATPRDGMTIVDELRADLRELGIGPPYVLVGHSLGGLYLQLFARRYPEEVAGLILVDATNPATFAGPPEHWPDWYPRALAEAGPVQTEELHALGATGARAMSLPAFTANPVIILSAAQTGEVDPARAEQARERRRELARLYPGATQIWVKSGHGIPLEDPAAVIDAIRSILHAPPNKSPL